MQNLRSWNLDFFFSSTSFHTKAKVHKYILIGWLDSSVLLHIHIYPTPPLGQDMTQGQFFKRSLTGLNSEFSFS